VQLARTGDAIDQEAPATRARAVKRRNWERGGPPPRLAQPGNLTSRIAKPGQTHTAISALPIAALRLSEETASNLTRLGLRRVGDLIGTPRAALARRFGKGVVRRLDQALGNEPEPVSPARVRVNFAVRLTLPDPIGLESDILAGIDRLLPALEARLKKEGHEARRIRMQFFRTDQSMQWIEIGLARPSANPDRIRPLLTMKLGDIDAGFGIDALRIEAHVTEPAQAHQHKGHLDASDLATKQLAASNAIDDLVGKIGARIGLETVIRRHPGNSHIPEKASLILAAAWSEPEMDWPKPTSSRPLLLWRPELVSADETSDVPLTFRWRQRDLITVQATGPERISPEWWLDEPEWRTGVRDYWTVTVKGGERLWLYFAHGHTMSAGWFCHGSFA
jgi:protein ImuB